MGTIVTYDKPGFEAHVLEKGGQLVCILSPTVFIDPELQARVRRLMWGQGIDCRKCRGCPASTAQ